MTIHILLSTIGISALVWLYGEYQFRKGVDYGIMKCQEIVDSAIKEAKANVIKAQEERK